MSTAPRRGTASGSRADEHTILVVETTAGGRDLLAAARREVNAGPCRFMVLVPQFGNKGQVTGNPALTRMYQSFRPGLLGPDVNQIERPVRRRLEAEVGALRAMGVAADGDVVSESLTKAVGRYVRSGVHTIIVSERPRWFGLRSFGTWLSLRFRVTVIRI